MFDKLPVNGFKCKKNASKFDEEFIKNMMQIVTKDIFLKQVLNILKICMICISIYHSYQKE